MLFPCSRFVSDTTADNAFKTMRLALVNRFGGYSDTTGAGGWSVGDDHNNLASGIVATERHCALSVSYKPNAIEDAWLQDFAEMYGRTLGQEWMHVEFHAIRVGHVKVR
jgi:aminoglycoside phosphotransferase